jgi:diguanylate cyclase (GGDEF)-like protein
MRSVLAKTLYSLALPGGLLLLVAVVVLQNALLPSSAAPLLHFYPYVVFAAGLLLGLRFNRSRVLLALLILVLADRSLLFFFWDKAESLHVGHTIFNAIAVLLPLNLIALSLMSERGTLSTSGRMRLGMVAAQLLAVAVICRPQQAAAAALLDQNLVGHVLGDDAADRWLSWSHISQPALLCFLVAFIVLLARCLRRRKPIEAALFWTLIAVFAALNAGAASGLASAYFATAGLILVISLVETSHSMAYQDELTGLPARRAFNEALLALDERYAIAMVDVDHFKKFNDSYGHKMGDHVLRMVAGKLADINGGGEAFRCGGEEFAVLFPGKSVSEACDSMESLRKQIEQSSFTVRGSDRRVGDRKRGRLRLGRRRKQTRVTVSIGMAEADASHSTYDKVIEAADRALYRAKDAGRNRLMS